MVVLGTSNTPLLNKPRPYFSKELDLYKKMKTLSLHVPLPAVLENGRVIMFVESGHGIIVINGVKFELKEGCACLLASCHVFSIIPAPRTVLQIKCTVYDYFTTSYIQYERPVNADILVNGQPPHSICPVLEPTETTRLRLERLTRKLEQEEATNDEQSSLIKASLYFQLLFLLNYEQVHQAFKNTFTPPLGWKIFSFMENFSNQWMSAQEMARIFDISVQQLNRELRAITGSNYSKLLNRARLNIAGTFLPYENISLRYIADLVGFPSEVAFINAFKAYYGMTPKDYRGDQQDQRTTLHNIVSEDLLAVIQYISQGFREDISIRTAAAALYSSEKRINRLTYDYAGMSFKALLVKTRLRFASALLLNSEMLVCDVSYAAGFPSPQTFWRQFKSEYGVTPNEYRMRGSNG